MAKFSGKVGFESEQTEISPGIFETEIVERMYYGDVVRNNRKFNDSASVLGETTVSNSISIVADAYAHGHYFAIRYVWWQGVRWTVDDVQVEPPRLLLRPGGRYNGPAPSTP